MVGRALKGVGCRQLVDGALRRTGTGRWLQSERRGRQPELPGSGQGKPSTVDPFARRICMVRQHLPALIATSHTFPRSCPVIQQAAAPLRSPTNPSSVSNHSQCKINCIPSNPSLARHPQVHAH